jgi:hypothetical protein
VLSAAKLLKTTASNYFSEVPACQSKPTFVGIGPHTEQYRLPRRIGVQKGFKNHNVSSGEKRVVSN